MEDELAVGAVWLSISPEDYSALRSLLIAANPLVTGNYADSGKFDLTDYLYAKEFNQVEFRALLDRNLLSPLVELAAGKSISGSEESKRTARIACACAAFCIFAGILIEPSMALYEYASTQGNSAAKGNYFSFRVADNIDPCVFVDLALGRRDHIDSKHINQVQSNLGFTDDVSPESNFERTLRLWPTNYLYVLKIAALKRSGLSPVDSALEFQRWQSDEAFYNAPASLYCLAAISHQPPKGQMLKGINSSNLNTLLEGLKNAAWDICMIQYFGRIVVTPNNPSWSLWSLDKAVREVTKALFVYEEQPTDMRISDFYSRCWGRDAIRLTSSYMHYSNKARLGEKTRDQHVSEAFRRIEVDIKNLESELGLNMA
jgi:hypothetical protein